MGCVERENPRHGTGSQNRGSIQRGGNAVIYRRDTHNRSLDDYTEAKPRTGQKAIRRSERAVRMDAVSAIPPSAPALAATSALK
jgi:hypothetical protein